MAIYHLSAQVISRKAGRSSTAAAAYRAGSKIEDRRTGETFDYTRKGGVYGSGILAPAGAPSWATDRAELWNQVELAEIRKDAQVCREIDVALPVELDDAQRVEAVRAFVQEQFVDQGMIADVAFHDFDSHNPHAHIMLTMRDLGPEGFGKKNRNWNQRELVTHWRKAWEIHANAALARAGVDSRIDHRSYETQGLDQEPTLHMGPAVAGMERRKPHSTRVGRENREIEERNLVRDLITQDIDEDQIHVDRLDDELFRVEIEIDSERRKMALEALRERVQPLIRKTVAFVQEHGIKLPENVLKALEDRGYINARVEGENLPREAERPRESKKDDTLDFLNEDKPDNGPGLG